MPALIQPIATKIFSGYLVIPFTTPYPTGVQQTDFQVSYSRDDASYSNWEFIGSGSSFTGYQFVHNDVFPNLYYQYRYRQVFYGGAVTDWSDYAIPGALSTADDYGSSLDQLASSLGTITSGFLRGVVFETSANYPKVRFDPTGFYSISGVAGTTATPFFIDATTGNFTALGGIITGATFQTATSGGRIVLDSTSLRGYAVDGITKTFELTANSGVFVATLAGGSSIGAVDITGTLTSSQIASVAAATITGSIVAAQIGSVGAASITGSITSGQIGSVAAGTITGTITSGQIASVSATTITGSIVAAQIGSVTASTILNGIVAAQITSVNSSALSGLVTATQIGSVNASVLSGLIQAAQINTIAAGQISGTITSAQIGSVSASTITGTITSGQIASVAATTITGTLTSTQIASVAATTITGSIISSQIGSVGAGTITGTIVSSQIASVTAGSITGTVTASQISVTSLAALSANLGAITAGTITGALVQTSATNPRVYLDSTGVGAVDVNGVTTFKADASTGKIITLTGIGGNNFVVNSSFEAGSFGWTTVGTGPISVSGATLTADATQGFIHGTTAGKVVTTATNQGISQSSYMGTFLSGVTYTGSVYVKTASGTVTVAIALEDNNLGNGEVFTTGTAVSTQWTRISVSWTPTANSPNADFYIYNTTGAVTFWVDGAQVEQGTFASGYAPKADEILPNTVTGAQISSNAGIVGSQMSPTANITSGQIGSVLASVISGSINASQITSIAATQITGTIVSGQIGSVAATTITGSITSGQIGSVSAGTITGSIVSTQIGSVNAATITVGQIASTQISSINAATITIGQIANTQISSVYAGNITIGGGGSTYLPISTIQAGSLTASLIAAHTITADNITVGTFGDSAIMNPGFEDINLSDVTIAAGWRRPAIYGGNATTSFRNTATPTGINSGIAAHTLVAGAGASAEIASLVIPVSLGDVWYFSCWAKSAGTNAGTSPGFYMRCLSQASGQVYQGTGAGITSSQGLENAVVPTTWTKYEALVTIPAGVTLLGPYFLQYSTNTGCTIYIDDVTFKKSTGAGNIFVPNLSAINANLGSITAGTITGTTITGNTISGGTVTGASLQSSSTANTGVKFDTAGIKAYDSAGNNTFALDATTGNLTLGAVNSALSSANTIVDSRADSVVGGVASTAAWPNTSGVVVSTVHSRSGLHCFAVPAAASGQSIFYREPFQAGGVSVTGGLNYTFSCYIWGTTILSCYLQLLWSTDGTTRTSTVTSPTQNCTTTGWTRLVFTSTAPAGAVLCGHSLFYTTVASQTGYFTDIQFEEGPTATGYAPKPDEILPGSVLTSAVIQTNANVNVNKVMFDSSGIRAYGATAGVTNFNLDSTGALNLVGDIHATSFTIDAAASGTATSNTIQWNSTTAGVIPIQLWGNDTSTQIILGITTNGGTVQRASSLIQMRADSNNSSFFSQLTITGDSSSQANSKISLGTGSVTLVLLDGLERSAFLKTPQPAVNQTMVTGIATDYYGGAGAYTNGVVIVHNIPGATGVDYFATVIANGVTAAYVMVESPSLTGCTLQSFSSSIPAANTAQQIYWMAIVTI